MDKFYKTGDIICDNYRHYWRTIDGNYIKYECMSDKHLINTHNLMVDKCIKFANYCMSHNTEEDLPEWVENAIAGLEEELEKRGLLKND